jgi:hypothetical protein
MQISNIPQPNKRIQHNKITSKIIPSKAIALLASSTDLISTNANFFSWFI